MSENSVKSVRNSVIATVVSTAIISLFLFFFPDIRGLVGQFVLWVWSGGVWLWGALNASYSMSGWAWLVIGTFGLIGILNIYYGLRGDSEEPEWKTYIEDRMYGAIWRWCWAGNSIQNLWCFCPGCDATLVYDDSSCRFGGLTEPKTDFICENCRGGTKVSSIKGGSRYYAVGAIEREIQRRIRTGEYKKD